jgi:hypothetical protein
LKSPFLGKELTSKGVLSNPYFSFSANHWSRRIFTRRRLISRFFTEGFTSFIRCDCRVCRFILFAHSLKKTSFPSTSKREGGGHGV